MKIIKLYKAIIISFLSISYTISFSQNMIQEGDFTISDFSRICPNTWESGEQIDSRFNYWESQFHNEAKYRRKSYQLYRFRDCGTSDNKKKCDCCNAHSPDLGCVDIGNGNFDCSVGMGKGELIQQKLLNQNEPVEGNVYKVRFKLKIPTNNNNFPNIITEESKLNFMLAKNKVKYKSEGRECGDDPIEDICLILI